MLYCEWAPRKEARRGTMLSMQGLENAIKLRRSPGFRSVYMFDAEAKEVIETQGSSQGFARFKQYSNTLFVDFDKPSADISGFQQWLDRKNLAYEKYVSGRSTGVHFHIAQTLYSGDNLAAFHKRFVESLDVGADLAIYRPHMLFRLPNTVHEVTGIQKHLVYTSSGQDILELDFDDADPLNKEVFCKFNKFEDSEISLKFVFSQLMLFTDNQPIEGTRTQTLWSLGRMLADSGISHSSTYELLLEVNNTWQNPKGQSEVARAAKDAYRHLKRPS